MKKGTVKDKFKGLTFAKAAKKVSDRWPERDIDNISARSFIAEMDELMKHQEIQKLKENAGKAIKNYRQPVEASAYAKKALGGFINPLQMANLGQMAGDSIAYNNASTDWDAQDPWAGMLANQSVMPIEPLGAYGQNSNNVASKAFNPFAKDGRLLKSNLVSKDGTLMSSVAPGSTGSSDTTSPLAGFEDWAKNNVFSPLTVGKGVEAIGKLAMLASGYDKAMPQYNPFESKIRQLMETRGVDLTSAKQDILSAQNAAEDNLDGIRSANVRTALMQNLTNNSGQALARTSMQQQQIQTGLQGEYSNVLNNLGQQRVSAENYAEQLTQQSKAGYQMGLQNILESAGGLGNKITDYRGNIAQQRLINSVLSTKDFKLADPRGVLSKAIQGKEISNEDFYSLVGQVQSGAMSQEELDAALENARASHKQRTGELATQKYGGWLKKRI